VVRWTITGILQVMLMTVPVSSDYTITSVLRKKRDDLLWKGLALILVHVLVFPQSIRASILLLLNLILLGIWL